MGLEARMGRESAGRALLSRSERATVGSRGTLVGDARGARPLARRRLTVEDHGKRVVSERGVAWHAPLTFAQPAVTNREQRVRRRRWRT